MELIKTENKPFKLWTRRGIFSVSIFMSSYSSAHCTTIQDIDIFYTSNINFHHGTEWAPEYFQSPKSVLWIPPNFLPHRESNLGLPHARPPTFSHEISLVDPSLCRHVATNDTQCGFEIVKYCNVNNGAHETWTR